MKKCLLLTAFLTITILCKSHEYIDSLSSALDTISSDRRKIGFCLNEFFKCSGPTLDECLEFVKMAEEINVNFKNKEAEAGIACCYGYYYQAKKQQDSAILKLSEAVEIYDQFDHENPQQSFAFGQLSVIYLDAGNYDKAVEWVWKAIDFAKSRGDSASVASNFANLANIYEVKEDFELAEFYYGKSAKGIQFCLGHLDQFEFPYDSTLMNNSYAINLGRYGSMLSKNEKHEKALEVLKEADALTIPEYYKMFILQNLAEAYKFSEEYDEALIRIEQSIVLADRLNLAYYALFNQIIRADILARQEKFDQALVLLLKVEDSISVLEHNSLVTEKLYSLLSEVCAGTKDFESAWKYSELKKLESDKTQKTKSEKLISSLQIEFESEEKERKNQLLKQENAFQQKISKIAIASAAGLLIALIIFGFLYRRNKRLKDNLSVRTEELEKSLETNKMLNREIHHRVKNNLQMISGLLELQTAKTENEEALKALNAGKSRVESIALLHQKLYQQQDLTEVDFQNYCQLIIDQMSGLIGEISLQIDLDNQGPYNIDIDQAIPLSLILNELLTNSLKYAFVNKEKGKINVAIRDVKGQHEFVYSDDGHGFSESTRLKNSSLGMSLIKELSRQLKGSVKWETDEGTEFRLSFPKLTLN
ncbi:MAG: sensor histidine kinase [Flavobacteriales bacterium]|nr:sensor histidine kinase [Flavobacteriales bacterium]